MSARRGAARASIRAAAVLAAVAVAGAVLAGPAVPSPAPASPSALPVGEPVESASASASASAPGPGASRTAVWPEIRRSELQAHLRVLADDLYEGRGIGTRGGALGELYLEGVMQAAGLEPAFGGSYRQSFAVTRVEPDRTARLRIGELEAEFDRDWVGLFPRPGQPTQVSGELVYVGYGIAAPLWDWDDYKGQDLRGTVLLMHPNEPGRSDRALFEGNALTYYGRWTYKFEEAARRGAAGVLLIHDDEDAGYGWDVVRVGWGGGTVVDPGQPDVAPFVGWISRRFAEQLLARGGTTLAELKQLAERRDFAPRRLGLRLEAAATQRFEAAQTSNIAGIVPGRRPGGVRTAIVVSAHHDHLGLASDAAARPFNGAIDNGSALALLLALARVAAARGPVLDADLVFVAVAAEEEGMLGSSRFVREPPLPRAQIRAALNLEMTTVWGEADDLVGIGARHSDLDDVLAAVAARHGLRVVPESRPEQGFFFRSDQFSFAKGGVPAVWIDLGESLRGRPAGEGAELRRHYRERVYHTHDDRFDPSWSLAGTIQLGRLLLEIAAEIDRRPTLDWKPTSPFRR